MRERRERAEGRGTTGTGDEKMVSGEKYAGGLKDGVLR